jgi:hypothetical protein
VAPPSIGVVSSWHLPKVLIRKSAIRACSGASTLKDQYLGQVPGGEKKRRRRSAQLPQKTLSLAQLLERCKRAQKIGDGAALSEQRPQELVGGGGEARTLSLPLALSLSLSPSLPLALILFLIAWRRPPTMKEGALRWALILVLPRHFGRVVKASAC